MFVLGLFAICLMIGFRYQVGGDWIPYVHIFERAQYQDFFELGRHGDVGYQALNWTAQELSFPFWSVNLVTGLIFSWGLARFARSTPNPWTALVVAIPYLVIVVAMGYTRQGAAIGILMCGIADFHKKGSLTRVAVYIVLAALFHKTAVVCLPLFFFGARGSKTINITLLAAFSIVLYQFFLSDSIGRAQKELSREQVQLKRSLDLHPAEFDTSCGVLDDEEETSPFLSTKKEFGLIIRTRPCSCCFYSPFPHRRQPLIGSGSTCSHSRWRS